MRTERVNLPPEGSEFYDAVAGGPIGAEPINGELATATVTATSPNRLAVAKDVQNIRSGIGAGTWVDLCRPVQRVEFLADGAGGFARSGFSVLHRHLDAQSKLPASNYK
jgi:hypothetical protein